MRREPAPVARPPVPPLAWLAAGLWAAALLAEEVSWRVHSGGASGGAPWVVGALGVVATVAAFGLSRAAGVRFAALGIAVGLLVSSASWARWRADVSTVARSGARDGSGVVVDDPEAGRGGWRVRVRLDSGATAVLDWPEASPPPACGARVSFRSAIKPPAPSDPYARVAERRGDLGAGRAWQARVVGWRLGPVGALLALRARVSRALERQRGPGGDLFASVVLGDRRRVAGTAVEQDFRVSGLGHVLAASALYVGLVFAALRVAARRWGLGPATQLAVGLTGAFAYAAVGGLRASMLRGLVACAVTGFASLAGRRHDALSAVSLAVAGILVTTPAAAFDLGLAMGVVVVAGMAVFGRLARAWVIAVLPDALRTLAPGLAAAGVAQLSALPLTAPAFGMLSLLGPLATLLVVPLLGCALLGGLAAAVVTLAVPRVTPLVIPAASALFAAAAGATHALAALPGAAIALGPASFAAALTGSAGILALWAFWPQPRRRRRARWGAAVACALLVTRLLPMPASEARLVVMDVGQGDAILVRDGGATMLVDCGPKPAVLRAALARQGVRRIDCVVLTHAHADHTGGLPGLAGVATVGWVGAPPTTAEDFAKERRGAAALTPLRGDRWRTLSSGATWRVGRTNVRVVWPERADATLSANDTSVILLLERDGFSALLLGDAEERPQQRLLDDAAVPPLDALKVSHHGSVNGLHERALAAWTPGLALISVGAGNDFGHPAPRTLRALQVLGTPVRRTDVEGDLVTPMSAAARPLAGRGGRVACATIVRARRPVAAVPRAPTLAETDGHLRARRPEARLSHLRRRGPSPRARGPPTARAALEGRRPRLQLRYVRG